MMVKLTFVMTGEVKAGGVNTELKSSAIGSCVVITAFYPPQLIGAMAHVMLPGKASKKNEAFRFRYAEDAVNELLRLMHVPASQYPDINICLVGAGNVLKREGDSICKNNIGSVLDILSRNNLTTEAQALGGTERRSVRFKIAKGEVYFTENGSMERLLWKSDANNMHSSPDIS
jgi:chemotaxis protein CheD